MSPLEMLLADPNVSTSLRDTIRANNYANARIKEDKEAGPAVVYHRPEDDRAPDGRKLGAA